MNYTSTPSKRHIRKVRGRRQWVKPHIHTGDEALVEWKAADEPITRISRSLCRSPGACVSRLSELVGVPRNEVVEALITGKLDEMPVRGVFVGSVRKLA